MTTFEEREKAFEKKFAHDQELKFKAEARRNKMLGEWAAGLLGITGEGVEDYVKAVVRADLAQKGDEDVFQKIRAALVDALGVEDEEVTPQATMVGDLGAESIDFLDIVFRLEREFGIKIPRGELFPESIFQGDPEFVQDGKVTARGLEELRTKMPFADLSGFEQNPEVRNLSDLFTVSLITRYIEGKLNGAPVN